MQFLVKILFTLLIALQCQAKSNPVVFINTFDSPEATEWKIGHGIGTMEIRQSPDMESAALIAKPTQNYLQLVSGFPALHLNPGDEMELHFTIQLLDSPPDNWGGFRFGLYEPKQNTGYFTIIGTGKESNLDFFATQSADPLFSTETTNRIENSGTGLGHGLQQGTVYQVSMFLSQKAETGSIGVIISDGEKAGSTLHQTEQPLFQDYGRIVIGTGEITTPFALDNIRIEIHHNLDAKKQNAESDALNGKISSITPSAKRLAELRELLQNNNSAGVCMGLGEPIDNRHVWKQLAQTDAAPEIIREAEQFLKEPWQARDKPLFQAQMKIDRSKTVDFERIRHDRLVTLTLAECLENKGRFLPALNTMLTALASEGTWTAPYDHFASTAWDAPIQPVDLVSSMLAADIANSLYWLHSRLDPTTVEKVDLALQRNMLTPMRAVIEDNFKANRFGWYVTRNNWNAVCLYGVLSAAMAIPLNAEERAFYIGITERSIRYFMAGFEDDGFYEEGFDYWNYGFSRFLVVHELLRRATGGEIDLLAQPKARIIGSYPLLAKVAGNYIAGYSDDNPGGALNENALAFFLRRCGEKYDTTKLGTNAFTRSPYLYIPALFVHPLNPPDPKHYPMLIRPDPVRQVMRTGQLYIFRPGNSGAAFGAYVKFGNNGGPHNHNDIGTYGIAFPDHSAPVYDPGKMIYTDQTFGGSRYNLEVNTSIGHSVPVVDHHQQGSGELFYARIIKEDFTETADRVTADITKAYACPNLNKLLRSVEYSRKGKGSYTIADEATFNTPAAFETAVTTFGTVEAIGENTLRFTENTQSVDLQIDTDGQPFEIQETLIPQKLACGKQGRRVGIVLTQPVEKARITLRFTPSEKQPDSGPNVIL